MEYRIDIQAFRAIAIILVMGAHFNVPYFEAGFIGVDIFFVISGYVITKLIYSERGNTGRFDYLNFYARRFNRLLPALLLMLLSVLTINYFLSAPQDQVFQLGNAIPVIFWSSNIQIALSNVNYFDLGAKGNLFLHTWSLGVEEQFYLVWPCILIFSLSLSAKRNWLFISFLAFVSFLTCVFFSFSMQPYAYYLMPARIWQFLMGGLVFLVLEKNKFIVPGGRGARWSHGLGVFILLLSMLWIDADKNYPGFQVLLPTIAMVFLLLGKLDGNSVAQKLYGLPIAQWLGSRSYSCYLWHWPYWFFINSLAPGSSVSKVVLAVALTCATAEISFRYVEHPMRRVFTLGWSSKKSFIANGFFIIVCMLFVHAMFGRAENNVINFNSFAVTKYMSDLPDIYRQGCDTDILDDKVIQCLNGKRDASDKVVLFGDSIGAQWFPAIQNIYGEHWSIVSYTKSACTVVDRPIYYEKIGRIYDECNRWREKAIANIIQSSPKIIFMGSGIVNLSADDWVEGLSSTVERLSETNAEIYIFRPTPRLSANPTQCLIREMWVNKFNNLKGFCENIKEVGVERNQEIFYSIREVTKRYKNVHLLDMNSEICQQFGCAIKIDGLVSYRDFQHLTASYVTHLSPTLERKISER